MNHEESMIVVALHLKLQWQGQLYMIIVMHIYVLVEP